MIDHIPEHGCDRLISRQVSEVSEEVSQSSDGEKSPTETNGKVRELPFYCFQIPSSD